MFQRMKQGAVDVVDRETPLSLDHVEGLQTLLEECREAGQPRVVLDLRDVALVDSAGLELLLDVQEEYRRHGGTLKLATPNDLCREILTLTGVGRRFEIFDDTVRAVGSFVG